MDRVTGDHLCVPWERSGLTSVRRDLTSATHELTSVTCELTSERRDVTSVAWRVHMNRCRMTIATGDVTSERDVVTAVRRQTPATSGLWPTSDDVCRRWAKTYPSRAPTSRLSAE